MSHLVKSQKRAVSHDDGGKAFLMTRRVAAECLLLSIGMAAEGPGLLYISTFMARIHFLMTVELNREQKCPNFILSVSLSLPYAGIPVSPHSLS